VLLGVNLAVQLGDFCLFLPETGGRFSTSVRSVRFSRRRPGEPPPQPAEELAEPTITQLLGPDEEGADELLSDSAVKRRAKSGIFFVGSWGALNLFVGFFGSIVLARTLLPRDFGIVAVGATLMMFTTSLADGGLGSGLIRRERPPSRAELSSALGLQLTLTTALAGIAAAVGLAVGGAGLVVALMMIGLPIAALQTPGRVVLSRALRFRAMATVEGLGVLTYYLWAVGGVLAGLGVWALASAVVVRAVVSAGGIVRVSGLGLLGPSYRKVRELKPVIAFGIRFQAVSLTGMVREQGLNAGIAAIAGVATLGLWTLTKRLLELPVLIFEPLHRVSFPLLSRMLSQHQDPARLLDRSVAVAGTASGLVLVGLAASAPELVPAVFGEQWRDVAVILQWVCAALLVAGPISVAGVGFLYAAGSPSVVLRATALHTVVLFGVTFALLPSIGPAAIGMGSLAGAVVDAGVMAHGIRRWSTARPLLSLAPTLVVATAAAAAGLAVTEAAAPGLAAGIAGGLTATVAYLGLLLVVRRAVLFDTVRLIVDALRTGLSRDLPASADQPEAARAATAS